MAKIMISLPQEFLKKVDRATKAQGRSRSRATAAKIVVDTFVVVKWFKTCDELPFIVAPPATPLLMRAARLGRELGLTFYDASFIALAVELDCAYVTADRRLYDRARTLPRVRHLSRVGSLS